MAFSLEQKEISLFRRFYDRIQKISPVFPGEIDASSKGKFRAKSFEWQTIVAHRAGETKDDFIADFAVGVGANFIKAGAPARGERVTKYNRLLEIEKEL